MTLLSETSKIVVVDYVFNICALLIITNEQIKIILNSIIENCNKIIVGSEWFRVVWQYWWWWSLLAGRVHRFKWNRLCCVSLARRFCRVVRLWLCGSRLIYWWHWNVSGCSSLILFELKLILVSFVHFSNVIGFKISIWFESTVVFK